jgi:hypothetical protein
MPAGRCSGCGLNDSARKVALHVLTCSRYLDLFRQDPARCLDPAAEYERYRTEELNPEARAERRDVRLRDRFAELDRQQAVQADRWRTPPDLLDD